MSSGAATLDVVEAAKGDFPALTKGLTNEKEKEALAGSKDLDAAGSDTAEALTGPNGEVYPTKSELQSLRRVIGDINWVIYTIAFVELCERFAYYGTTAVFVNFIQWPLPEGSPTGSDPQGQPGALGLGQRASTALTLFNSFWSYVMPIVGGYMADTYWGRYKTINIAIGVATFGHIIIIIASIPQVMTNPNGALGCFIVGLIFFGMGVGFFKCNISPMVAEQYESMHPKPTIKVLKDGERVIVDPTLTISIIYMRFYFFINVGALVGQISMVWAEMYVGFWLSFTLPTIMFFFCPFFMIYCRKRYIRTPPTGSVLSKATKLWSLGMRGHWSANPVTTWRSATNGDFWERVKPSRLGSDKPAWMTFDDAWVDEVRRGFKACTVFVWYPLFWLSYSQMTNNLVSQAATMKLGGVPNDIIHNLNPLSLLIFIPIFDRLVYPAFAKIGIRFTPIKKITLGFAFGALAMMVAAVIQHFIYTKSPCGFEASGCDTPPPMSVWIQTPAYVLIAFSEIFASITGLEYAFTKAPKNMRSLVTGVFWLAQAFSSAIGQAFVGLSEDPHLIWLYTTVAIISALAGVGFWFTFSALDREEDSLNALPDAHFEGARGVKTGDVDMEESRTERGADNI